MVQRGLYLAALLVASLSLGVVSFAGEADMMKQLMDRVNALEAKNAELERASKANQSTSAAVDEAIKKEDDTAKALNVTSSVAINIGGYIDSSFEYNFNQPKNQNNNLRVFDTDSNGYNIHLAELTFDALPKKAGEAGFRMDLAYGTDVRVFKATDKVQDPSFRNNQFMDSDLKQAYIEYNMTIPCTDKFIKIDMGKFVTSMGYETIEAADNINSSRSYLFGFAIPFTHTGVRATYDVFDSECLGKWTIAAHAVNGWDNTQDTNRGKSYGLMSDWAPTKWFEWIVQGMVGVERSTDNRAVFATATNAFNGGDPTDPTTPGFAQLHKGDTLLGSLDGGRDAQFFTSYDKRPRYLIDTSMIFKPFCGDKLTLAVNADIAGEGGNKWMGVAGYVKWQFAKKWYLGLRGEVFDDVDGARTGIRQVLSEGTVTLDYAYTDALHSRLEFRSDRSNKGVFDDGQHGQNGNLNNPFDRKYQNTIMASWLYKF